MHNRLKLLRKEMGLTQSEFADKLGISQTFLSAIERGDKGFSASLFLALKDLGVNFDWFVCGEGEMFRQDSPNNNSLVEKICSILKQLPPSRQEFVLKVAQDQKNLFDLLEKCRLDSPKM